MLKIVQPASRSFIVKGDAIAWNNPWHFHPEIELLYCIQGRGTNFVGNHISPIEPGELLLFGKNLPHTRQRDASYYQRHPDEQPETIVVQFVEDFLGDKFFSCRELMPVRLLLDRAQRGIRFSGAARAQAIRHMEALRSLDGVSALITLITLLDGLAQAAPGDYAFLNPESYIAEVNSQDAQKISRIFAYTAEHYQEHIPLATVAALAHLSIHAFCRYFKARTRKSYTQYLAEVRITRACEALMEGDKDIKEVCFLSGFNNLSNFHKWFRRITGLTPAAYRTRALAKTPAGIAPPQA
ncbi:MAG: AraC family transcriptional regulator [Bacteroidia bacterium]|nr:AraC family transcriptional regulator [Bacteroidia bacterium]